MDMQEMGESEKSVAYDVEPATIVEMLGYLFMKGIKMFEQVPSIQLLMLPHLFESGTGYLDKGIQNTDTLLKCFLNFSPAQFWELTTNCKQLI